MQGANTDAVRRGFEAVLRGDLDAIRELLDPQVKWHGGDANAPGACHNRDEALAFMRHAQASGGGQIELVDVVGSGDRVALIMRPPSEGDEPARTVANLVTFRAGKVVEMVHYPDAEEALAAVRK